MRTPLSRAHGLGAAGEGTGHWWMQRVTSLALVPLALWFGFALARLPDFAHTTVRVWMSEPPTTILMIAFLIVTCYHLSLGLRVIVEDYVHHAPLKIAAIIVIQLGAFLMALVGTVATIKVSF